MAYYCVFHLAFVFLLHLVTLAILLKMVLNMNIPKRKHFMKLAVSNKVHM